MELQKTLTPGEALERVLRSYQTYYNIKTEAVEPPFAAEAIFGSHNEQYFLIKKAKVADIDTNETVYFATEESLSKDRLLELDSIAWERGTANVQPIQSSEQRCCPDHSDRSCGGGCAYTGEKVQALSELPLGISWLE